MVVTRERAFWKTRRCDLDGNACCVAARPPPRFENAFTSDQAMVIAALSLERHDASKMSGVRRLSSLALRRSTSRLKGPATRIAARAPRASVKKVAGGTCSTMTPWSVERTTPLGWRCISLQIADIDHSP
jgi:hypothetical protein